MVVSNLKTFIRYEIFYKKIDRVSHHLAATKCFGNTTEKRTNIFFVVLKKKNKYIVVRKELKLKISPQ